MQASCPPRASVPALGRNPSFCYPLIPRKAPLPLAIRLGLLTLWYLVWPAQRSDPVWLQEQPRVVRNLHLHRDCIEAPHVGPSN
jgi:hypothetical protein